MNMEELNSCFDSITPTKEQKSKMLDAVMKAKVEPVKVVKLNRYKYLSAVAAVLVIGVFAIAYSNMGRVEEDIYLPEVAVEDSNTKVETTDVENNVISTDENKSTEGKKSGLTEAVRKNYPESDENVKTGVNTLPKTKNEEESNEGVQPKTGTTSQSIDNTNKNQAVNNVVTDEKNNVTQMDKTVEKTEVALNTVKVSETAVADEANDDVNVSRASGGGGGGGSSSGGSANYRINYELSDIQNHNVYSSLVPLAFAEGYEFESAVENTGGIEVYFETDDGRYMSIKAFKKDVYEPYQQIVTPEEIKSIPAEGFMEFALEWDDYYLIYYVETNNADDVYEMVKSSACFK